MQLHCLSTGALLSLPLGFGSPELFDKPRIQPLLCSPPLSLQVMAAPCLPPPSGRGSPLTNKSLSPTNPFGKGTPGPESRRSGQEAPEEEQANKAEERWGGTSHWQSCPLAEP